MRRFARWLAEKLLETREGKLRAPGSSASFSEIEVNGTSLTVLANGDSFDVFQGHGQIHSFSVSSRIVRRLVWFVIRWWIRDMWFGLKPRLWRWAHRRSS